MLSQPLTLLVNCSLTRNSQSVRENMPNLLLLLIRAYTVRLIVNKVHSTEDSLYARSKTMCFPEILRQRFLLANETQTLTKLLPKFKKPSSRLMAKRLAEYHSCDYVFPFFTINTTCHKRETIGIISRQNKCFTLICR